ncbi:hypothetical protein BTJ68_13766 [Hortaea werneckii EXF-2000]|uniref:Uncharacterized protein n=1 Tax=Hortaea werneckii EXF-2000 TaxID=1157616 RepID=A0A1Z5SQI2_HORWE|nr:hypothetical protein BTJ68_13766 [Hortaea werneckii EXF-2000]
MSESLPRRLAEYSCEITGSGADVRLGPTLAVGSSPLLETEGVYAADSVSEAGVTRVTLQA